MTMQSILDQYDVIDNPPIAFELAITANNSRHVGHTVCGTSLELSCQDCSVRYKHNVQIRMSVTGCLRGRVASYPVFLRLTNLEIYADRLLVFFNL